MSDEPEMQLPGAGSAKSANEVSKHVAIPATHRRKPTAQELKQILARHRGWLAKPENCWPLPPPEPLPENEPHLDHYPPRDLDWRNEALRNPERAHLFDCDLAEVVLCDANLNGASLSECILTGANLTGAHLRQATLSRANLTKAELRFADLTEAELTGANLSAAHLNGANLSGANLNGANLTEAGLGAAILTNAKLQNADLTKADLEHADLTEAYLGGVNLTAAKLAYANLTKAWYAPASEPPHPYVASIKGISEVHLPYAEAVGLVQLRKLFQDAGLRALEREATYRIEDHKTWDLMDFPFAIRSFIRWAAFDVTTAYGLKPFRALLLIMVIWLLCTLIYSVPIVYGPGQSEQASGIYRVLLEKRISGPADNPQIKNDLQVHRIEAAHLWQAVPSAAYFSLFSAVNIGFQEFTPGDWIRRLLPHEYDLRAEGWVRCVSGLQALLSVFLLAMWVLTQFGRPFQ